MTYPLAVISLLMFFAAVTPPAQAHHHPAYAHDDDIAYRNPSWMANLDDDLRLSDLSLPGTHNSMSFYGGDSVATQSLPLRTQLEAGIRVFDLRVRVVGAHMAMHHGWIFQHAMLGDVFKEMRAFLQRNPGEVLLARVRQEHAPQAGAEPFEQVFRQYRDEYAIEAGHSIDPRLGEVRGKIIILQDFSSRWLYGIPYKYFSVQDNYDLGTIWGLYQKWLDVKAHLDRANASSRRAYGFIHYLSGSGGGIFPYFVASGHSNPATGAPRLATGLTTFWGASSYPDFPRVSCLGALCTIAYEGINVLTQQYIQEQRPRYLGMVLADFPGPGLIDSIIELNLKPCQPWTPGQAAVAGAIYRHHNPHSGTIDYYRARYAGSRQIPPDRRSNVDWQFLGHDKVCRQ